MSQIFEYRPTAKRAIPKSVADSEKPSVTSGEESSRTAWRMPIPTRTTAVRISRHRWNVPQTLTTQVVRAARKLQASGEPVTVDRLHWRILLENVADSSLEQDQPDRWTATTASVVFSLLISSSC